MQKSTKIGLQNRTGMQSSPKLSEELLETVKGIPGAPLPAVDGVSLSEARVEHIHEADPLGTFPAPRTAKGMLKAGAKMLTGKRPQVFIDKLAERAAFERGGTRLYDALLTKFLGESNASNDGDDVDDSDLDDVSEVDLRQIRDEEASHFRMLVECIESLGGDPTAETPGADLVGVETSGLLQVVSDPRTSFAQSLHAVLAAELVDHAGWELLCQMAQAEGQDEMLLDFQSALQDEQDHLRTVRKWFTEITLAESGA
jgi:ferritin-like protein